MTDERADAPADEPEIGREPASTTGHDGDPTTGPTTEPDGAPSVAPGSWRASELDEVERGERSRRLPYLLGAVVLLLVGLGAYLLIAKPFEAAEPQVWPTDVGGRPEGLGERGELAEQVTPEVGRGAYLWNDFDGWHLWFVLDSEFSKVSGTIVSDDDIGKAILSPAATGTVDASGDTLRFDIESTTTNLAGIDFEPGFYAERLEISIVGPDGEPLPAELVHRGSAMAPAPLPVVVEKVDAPDAS